MCEVSTRLARNCPGESPGPGRLPQRYADGRLDVTALDSFTWKTILFRFFFTARICGDSVGMLSAMGNSDSTSHIFNILEGTEKAPDRKSLIAGIHGTHKYSQDV